MSYIDELNAPKSVTSSGYGSVQDLCDKFAIACAEVDSLRRQLAEARKDKERIDWLDSLRHPEFEWAVREHKITGCGGLYQLIKFAKGDISLSPDVRAAIDQARASQHSGEGK